MDGPSKYEQGGTQEVQNSGFRNDRLWWWIPEGCDQKYSSVVALKSQEKCNNTLGRVILEGGRVFTPRRGAGQTWLTGDK